MQPVEKREKILEFVFDESVSALSELVGTLEENLRQIETAFGVTIARRGPKFSISGEHARIAYDTLQACAAQVREKGKLSLTDVQLLVVDTRHATEGVGSGIELKTRRAGLKPRTSNQRLYLQAIAKHDLTFGVGPAGTGKTYLAVAAAVDAYERGCVERIILTRPAIEAGERLGFLPGDLAQKVDPYLRPLYDALFDLFGFEKTQRLMEKQVIEIAPLAYMRGRTLNDAFVILDEAQNTTCEQMKMFLTRIGFGTHTVVTGDVTQIDLPKNITSGLKQALEVLEAVRGIAVVRFNAADVVRHPLVASIVRAYEAMEHQEEGRHAPAKAHS